MIPADTATRLHRDTVQFYSRRSADVIAAERARRVRAIDAAERWGAMEQLRNLACTVDAPYETKLGMLKIADVLQPWVVLSFGPLPASALEQTADRIEWERITIAALDSIA
jgi:hypothetical protein